MGRVIPYREAGEPGLVIVERKARPRGLVRANGALCRCSPPGRIFCWWYDVQPDDRWFCEHDGGWLRRTHHGTPLYRDHWVELLPEGDE
jgi:hypothetical protein